MNGSMIRQTPITCTGHSRPVVDIEFSDITDDLSYYLISASKDGKPQLREGGTGDWLGTFEGHKGAIWAVDISYNGTRAATGAADFTSNYWDAETGNCLASFTHSHIVKSVSINRDTHLLLTGTSRSVLSIWDVRQPQNCIEEYTGHNGSIKGCKFLGNDNYFITTGEDKLMKMWDRRAKKELKQQSFDQPLNSMVLKDDVKVVTVTYGNNVALYDVTTFDLLRTHSLPCVVNSASLHLDQRYFVCGGEDLYVYKVSIETGRVLESYKKHFGPVHCIRYSPDGELYASGSEDGTIRLWQNCVGKTYGLWQRPDLTNNNCSPSNQEFVMS